MPVPRPALAETRFGIQTALMKVDIIPQQLADGLYQSREGRKTPEWIRIDMRPERQLHCRLVVFLADDLRSLPAQDIRYLRL